MWLHSDSFILFSDVTSLCRTENTNDSIKYKGSDKVAAGTVDVLGEFYVYTTLHIESYLMKNTYMLFCEFLLELPTN